MSDKLKTACEQPIPPERLARVVNAAIAFVNAPAFRLFRMAMPEAERLAREVEDVLTPTIKLTECTAGHCLDPTRCGRHSQCLHADAWRNEP